MSGGDDGGRAFRRVAVVALVVGVVYLGWRWGFTTRLEAGSILFTALETWAWAELALFVFGVWRVEPAKVDVASDPAAVDGVVAILIATYDEPAEVLGPVIAAATRVRRADRVCVLDDGGRSWVRELADELGAECIQRNGNTHRKAGNLNHALEVVDADFVVTLDADHVPAPDFVEKTLPYFADERVALVQTPQDFYNVNSFEHAPSHEEEALFYRVIQPGKNRVDAAFWCGTSSMLRTAALADVGGVAVTSITEDLETTVSLHRNGWSTVFHDEVLAKGLAAVTYEDFRIQRRRWAAGSMQVIRSRFIGRSSLGRTGLGWRRTLAYAASLTGWFSSWRLLGFMLLMGLVVVTGQVPIAAPLEVFLPAWLLFTVLSAVAQKTGSRGYSSIWHSFVFDLIRLPVNLRGTLRLLHPGELTFQVTPKGRGRLETNRIPAIHLVLIVGGLFVWAWGLATLLGRTPLTYDEPLAVGVTLAFLALMLAGLVDAAARISDPRFWGQADADPPLAGSMPAKVNGVDTALLNVTMRGAEIDLSQGEPNLEGGRAEVDFGPAGVVESEVVDRRDGIAELRFAAGDDDLSRIAASLVWDEPRQTVGNEFGGVLAAALAAGASS